MIHPARFTRGSAMVETAMVLSTVLLLVFGGLQIGLAGYYQVAADGAVYLAAHNYALGGTDPTKISGPFPGIDLTNIVFTPAPPDPLQEPVNYNYSNSSARYGGAQMIRPEHLQASLATSMSGFLTILGFNAFPITAGAVEGRDWMANHDLNVDGTDPNSSATYNGMLNPLYTDDGNVPPYFIGSNYIEYCPIADWNAGGTTCGNPGLFLALGLAEYLDASNYTAPNNGVGSNATFHAMLFHQQVYASLIADFPPVMPIYDPANDVYDPQLNPDSNGYPNAQGDLACVYNWDNFSLTGYPTNSTVGQYPLAPLNACP